MRSDYWGERFGLGLLPEDFRYAAERMVMDNDKKRLARLFQSALQLDRTTAGMLAMCACGDFEKGSRANGSY